MPLGVLARFLAGLALVATLSALSWPAVADGGKEVGRRYALVIGNAAYRHVTPLANPVNDSVALCAALKSLRFETDCRQNLPDRRSIRDAVRNFTKGLKPEDVALIYFAGHGIEVDGENYLIPTEADLPTRSYVEDEAMRMGFIFDELREARVRLSILILDACRNNPFSKVRSTVGTGLSAPGSMPAGSIVIFPTAPGKVAHDGSGKHGLFTTHLLNHLNAPGITIEEMFKRVIDGVRQESLRYKVEQIPWMNLSFTGEFCFVGCGTRVSTEQYQALVREKEQVDRITAELQGKLTERQAEVDVVKLRMQALESRLSRQQLDASLSRSEQATLAAERQELASKTAQVAQQQVELARMNDELARLQRGQQDFQRRETEMVVANERIALLEQQLKTQEERGFSRPSGEATRLQKEKAELVRQQQSQDVLRAELSETRQKLERMQQALAMVDRQRQELDAYKARMARLESEGQKKDEALRMMRGDLDARERELASVRTRLTTLQDQLLARSQDSKMSESALAKLREERDALVQSSRLLTERDRELRVAREQLQRLEARQTETSQREQNISAYQSRIAQLERQLTEAQANRLPATEMASLSRERDELTARNESLRNQARMDHENQRELEELRKRLQNYDQQHAQLSAYKNRLAEAEQRLKDAAAATVKGAAIVPPAL